MYPRPLALHVTNLKQEVITRSETTSTWLSSRFSSISTVLNDAFGSRLEHSAYRNYISHFLSPFFTWVNVRAACRKAIPPAPTPSSSSTSSTSSSSLLRLSFRVPTTILSTAEAKDMKAAAEAANSEYATSQQFRPQQFLDSISFLQQLHDHHHHRRLVKYSRSSSTSQSSSLFTPSRTAFNLQNAAPSVSEFPLLVLGITPNTPNLWRRSVTQEQNGSGQRQS